MAAAKKKAPWKKAAPKTAKHRSLTSAQKSSAKRAAKKAGRPYPNLVDNMHAAAKKKSAAKKQSSSARKKTAAKKKSTGARKKTARKKTGGARRKASAKRKRATRDPRGGLTAAGRRAFARSEGAHLRPGVTKAEREMSPAEMRRKGSWAVRFYGRSGALPPLVGDDGEPTRFALTAAAWGEPVPRTAAAARRIAAKGRRLLEKYERAKARG